MRQDRRAARWRCRGLGRVLAAGLAAAYASAAPVAAQAPPTCPEGRIGEIVIDNHSVFDLSDPGRAGGRFAWAYRLANTLHVRTRAHVVQRELLFQVGDCYEVEELRDSERMLREFGFLANAEIFGVPNEDGSMRVVVDTQDEWSTKVQPKVESDGRVEFQGIELVEDNLLGTGRHFSLFYEEVDDQRVYGSAYSTPQFLRTRTNMTLRLARTDVGSIVQQALTYPFVGEAGRIGVRQVADRRDRYFELLMPRRAGLLERVWVPIRREHVELAAAVRRGGERYRHTLFGGAIAAERVSYPDVAVFADTLGRPPVPSQIFARPWEPLSSVRVVGLIGRRDVQFVRRRGFDTVDGVEDVQLGFDGELSLGAAVPGLSPDEDVSMGARAAWAGEPRPSLTWGIQLSAEGRHPLGGRAEAPLLNDVLAEGDAWAYLRPRAESRQTLVASLSAVGGWNGRVPFQLTLGGDTGLRGYPRHFDPGGRRVVASVEHRAHLDGVLPELLDLGSVVFFDAGKIWPGDAIFGTESPLRATVGVGIRAAFPPGSRQTFRADIGLPIQGDIGLRAVVFSVGVGQSIGRRITRPDQQLLRSANFGLTASDFLYGY